MCIPNNIFLTPNFIDFITGNSTTTSFPLNLAALSSNTTASSALSFSNVTRLNGRRDAATRTTQTISFNGVNRQYFRFSSTGFCETSVNVVSRTLSVYAILKIIL
ncbi:hypothetical protein GPUN_0053 [Glaciecola punicea ACAM 611]|jgi:hypothetical protein|uniref:Uncharacterized protein n=1 Tax=Glaciecola punicea ACAM 611 TaxID=1121923 RepID=H5T7D0_9ALTE|nr:hypothetical protein [Glaciecola punicea]GAB54207.1 hypothetical protein GPUN_0053 [Glaciecola punicea ACAM 611]